MWPNQDLPLSFRTLRGVTNLLRLAPSSSPEDVLKNDKRWLQITPCKPEAALKCVQGIADFSWPLTDPPEKTSWALLTQSQAGHCPRQCSAQLLTRGTHGRNSRKRQAQNPHFTHEQLNPVYLQNGGWTTFLVSLIAHLFTAIHLGILGRLQCFRNDFGVVFSHK